ncbi:adenosine deaminase-like protein isoform X3 [Ornithorhynchus anatinus]|nr:adenosine deaminase-like protein isoform X3 [Ornithorhynchus anatinus]
MGGGARGAALLPPPRRPPAVPGPSRSLPLALLGRARPPFGARLPPRGPLPRGPPGNGPPRPKRGPRSPCGSRRRDRRSVPRPPWRNFFPTEPPMADEERQPRRDPFYSEMPKVELHAHLNGSISSATMKKLIALKPHLKIQDGMPVDKEDGTLEEYFRMFQLIHQITNRTEDVLMVTKDVIKEFADDGVKYLELRSTPRGEITTGMTKRTYVEAVLEGIKQSKEENLDIDVRYLMAVDRRGGPAVARETVKLAEEFFLSTDDTVLGLDLSGDPTVGHGEDFFEPLLQAKKAGLKLALHLAEIPGLEKETQVLLGLPPDRIGHGTFLHRCAGAGPSLTELVRRHRIPIEFCLTSNVRSRTVPSYDRHHFGFWYGVAHPSVICTDDKGIFDTRLSREYQLAAENFRLSQAQAWDLSYKSIDCIFASGGVKAELRKKWSRLKPGPLSD